MGILRPYPELSIAGVLAQRPQVVRRIQTIGITIPAGASSATATLSQTVNKAHAYAYLNGWRSAEPSFQADEDLCSAELTDGDTVTVRTAVANASNTRIVGVQVVEWCPWAARVEHGSSTLSGGTATQNFASALASPVDASRAAFIHCGQNVTNPLQNQDACAVRGTLNSDGQGVTLNRNVGNGAATVYWAVVEFAASLLASRQQQTISFSGTTQTATSTISAVDPDATMLFWGGCELDSFQDDLLSVELTDATTLTASGGRSVDNSSRKASVTVIEFNPEWVRGADQVGATIAAGEELEETVIGEVNLAKTIVHATGFHTDTAAAGCEYCTLGIVDSTTFRTRRGNTGAYTVTSKVRALEFY